jgi:hypothetical protein
MATRPEIYFSFDIEADGPHPADFSMLSLALVACARFDGKEFTRLDIEDKNHQFYSTLAPVTKNFVPEAVEVAKQGGADRDELLISGPSPFRVMPQAAEFIDAVVGKDLRPIGVCFPAWDISWLYSYFERYSARNPFGFSGYIDMKSFYIGRQKAMVVNATKRNMPAKIKSKRPHTHNALDDALEQAEMFANMWEKL